MRIAHVIAFLAIAGTFGGCSTIKTSAGSQVPSSAYNAEIEQQGLKHYCGTGVCDTPPVLVHGVAPLYPAAELKARRPGFASVIFDIEPSGDVSNVKLESSSNPSFGAAAMEAVKGWRYKPATLNGVPVKLISLRQKFPFNL